MSAKTSGGQPGNENAREGRRWREALRRALSRLGNDIDAGLDRCADRLVAAAVQGKPWALEHIAERFDGKAVQHVTGSIEHNVNVGSSDTLAPALGKAVELRTKSTVQ